MSVDRPAALSQVSHTCALAGSSRLVCSALQPPAAAVRRIKGTHERPAVSAVGSTRRRPRARCPSGSIARGARPPCTRVMDTAHLLVGRGVRRPVKRLVLERPCVLPGLGYPGAGPAAETRVDEVLRESSVGIGLAPLPAIPGDQTHSGTGLSQATQVRVERFHVGPDPHLVL